MEVEMIEDIKEGESLPTNQMHNPDRIYNDGVFSSKSNDPPQKKKTKNVHFDNEVKGTGNNDAPQRKKSDDGGKSKNLPPEKT